MRPFQSSEYAVLPVEEKQEVDHDADAPVTKPRRSRTFLAFIVALFSLIVVLGVVAVQTWAPASSHRVQQHGDEKQAATEADLHDHLSRATGDQYLLGVGKADITGPVVELNFMGYASLAQIGKEISQIISKTLFQTPSCDGIHTHNLQEPVSAKESTPEPS